MSETSAAWLGRLVLATLLAAGSEGDAHGADPAVPTEVTAVSTAGYWRSPDGVEGSYRAVVTQDGWDHAWSRVRIEWVAQPRTREGSFSVVASAVPALPVAEGSAVLEVRLTPNGRNRLHVLVIATRNMPPFAVSRHGYLATLPGRIQVTAAKRGQ